MRSRRSRKGRSTVPAGVRKKRGIRAATAGDEHPVDRVFGTLRLDKPVDELLNELRGPRPLY